MICSVDGCLNQTVANGLCNKHYRRNRRHGHPTAGRTIVGSPQQYIQDVVLPWQSDECLTWPFSRHQSGYGRVTDNGRQTGAHRVVCKLSKGPPPTDAHEAAHSCGNGHLGCVNPKHLDWKTRAENHADRIIHGTHNRGERNPIAILTGEQVADIRALAGKVPNRELARRYAVSPATIRNIQKRRTWRWI